MPQKQVRIPFRIYCLAFLAGLLGCPGFNYGHASAEEIKIAWLAMEEQVWFFSAANCMGALVYSIEETENDPTLLPGYNFR